MILNNAEIMLWKGKFSPEEEIRTRKFVLSLFKLLYEDENYGFYHCRIFEEYRLMAIAYMKLENTEEMFSCLEKAAEHAIKYDKRCSSNYTAFMVNRTKFSPDDAVKGYTENASGLLLKALKGKRYEKFRDDERLNKIIETLIPVAKI